MESHQTTDPTGYAPAGPLDDVPPGRYAQPEVRRAAFDAALAGVDLGAYDRRILDWLVGWDDPTDRTIVSLIWRAREAAAAAGTDTAAAELTSLASWIDGQLADETADRQQVAESAAARIRDVTLALPGDAELRRRAAGPRGAAPGDRGDAQRAAGLLAHSLRFGVEAAGKRWDGDNDAECELIVAHIIDAAKAGVTS